MDQASQSRAFAQAIAFGPNGKLYVPIASNGPDTGSVQAYNMKTKAFNMIIPSATFT